MPASGFISETTAIIKRSRFITTLARTDDETEARGVIAGVRSAHPGANHYCSAFVLEDGGGRSSRSSDDGEPGGTAGVPMLNALVGADLVNVTAVVARFFGGVKLGAGGLIRAYGGCVADAIKGLPRVSLQSRTIWTLDLPHGEMGRVQEELLRGGGTLMDITYQDASAHLVFTFPTDPKGIIARATQGGFIPLPDRVEMVEVPI